MSIAAIIKSRLTSQFNPILLDVVNESNNHSVPPNSETHFKIVMVCNAFVNKSLIKRHQAVYQALQELLPNQGNTASVHALALHLFTAAEWQSTQSKALKSPPCLGGGGKSAE
ncbi:MAG: hypothetical protein A3F18_08625 [Legionellales bacterium RIFCSPHIGHO2_12_FULL_37_14]|nr:MAG: hypothetical protein A3F18_08625 [Legionellales bacterium RIFCSPHIGHO2_12_FULL_37_14]